MSTIDIVEQVLLDRIDRCLSTPMGLVGTTIYDLSDQQTLRMTIAMLGHRIIPNPVTTPFIPHHLRLPVTLTSTR